MKKRKAFLLLAWLLGSGAGFAQPADTTFFVEVLVQEMDAQTPVPDAEVYFIGQDDTRTDAEGRALFPGVRPGPVEIIVRAKGFRYAGFQRDIFRDRVLTLELRPVPADSFSIKGKVVNATGESLPGAQVKLLAGMDYTDKTQTDSFGYFQFLLAEADLDDHLRYHVDYRKPGYREASSRDRTLDYKQRDHDLGLITLQPAEAPAPAKPPLPPSPFSLLPGLSGNLVTGDEGANAPFLTPSVFLLYQSPYLHNRLAFTAGLYLPARVTTLNTYETVAGQINELPTEYRLQNFLTLGVRLYLFDQKEDRLLRPFGETSLSLSRQSPREATFEEGAFQIQRENYTRLLPRLAIGLGIDLGLLAVEPFVGFSAFGLKSESFEFNYFGQAMPVAVTHSYWLAQAGLNVRINIPVRP